MFEKLVAIEPVSLVAEAEKKLNFYAREVVMYEDIPSSDEEILRRIGDADCVLLSYTSRLTGAVMEKCPNLKYVGMCCSLYSEESANVDIAFARSRGIVVKGIRDYGDRGVVEYVLWQLIGLLHGFGGEAARMGLPTEITDLQVGVIGLGVSGTMIAQAMQFMGAKVSYYSRTRKADAENAGMVYRPLPELLENSQVVFACLNKNVILLKEAEFAALGKGKVLFNTSIGPAHDLQALEQWLQEPSNCFCCDTAGALGNDALLAKENVRCMHVSAGRTAQAFVLLSQKVLNNMDAYFRGE